MKHKSDLFCEARCGLLVSIKKPLIIYHLTTLVYQKALIPTFRTSFLTTNNLCGFTALEHKLKR